ncbi:MAG: YraN family protein [Bacteroidales bacterium]|jgi:putative endonuclease|nr:YraN family protein [Bacteroidales bacterium]
MAAHNDLGTKGESEAKAFLLHNEYEVWDTNWHCGNYEVDIIARKKDTLVFCEVKSRTSAYFGEPESFVSKQKQRNLIKAAAIYAERKQWQGDIRFDIISVLFFKEQTTINHIEDAFGCTW